MKLRNKKTGEITQDTDWDFVGLVLKVNHVEDSIEMDDRIEYHSLAELNDEWEDYKELKKFWYISQDGLVYSDNDMNMQDGYMDRLQVIGNYFETKEEAMKVAKKLRAWKRLKDAGCKFVLDDNLVVRFVTPNATKIETAEQQKSLSDDYKLLFGGKE